MKKNLLLFLIGAFLIPDCFISRHVTAEILGISIFVTISTIYWGGQNKTIKITPLLQLVILSFIIWIFYQFFNSALAWHDWIEYISFMLLFFIFSQQDFDEKQLKQYYFVGSLIGTGMGCWGILQYFGIFKAYHASVPVSGSFENPTGIAIFLAALLPSSLFFTKERKTPSKIWGYITSLLSIFVVLLSNSRTGILAVVVTCVLHMYQKKSSKRWFKHVNKYFLTAMVLCVILLFVGLYYWKKDSADGRILIWSCSLDIFRDHWLLGIGSGKFQAEYMLYQADFFRQHPDSIFAILADNTKHPFNEYLKILAEYGIVGFIMFVAIFIHFIKLYKYNQDKSSLLPIFESSLVIGLAAWFSYPLNYPSIILILVLNVAIVNSYHFNIWTLKMKNGVNIVKFGLIIFALLLLRNIYFWGHAEYKWCKIADRSLAGKTKEMLPQYQNIYNWMKRDGLFLYNYGAELQHVGEYNNSLKILNDCYLRYNDMDVQLLIAENYLKLEMYKEAREHLLLAANMCPVRFVPLYKLMNIYLKTKDITKAKYYAEIIVNKPIKINSIQIRKMKSMAQKILNF